MADQIGMKHTIALWNIICVIVFSLLLNSNYHRLTHYHIPLFLNLPQIKLKNYFTNIIENIEILSDISNAFKPTLNVNYPLPIYNNKLDEFHANFEADSAYPFLNGSLIGVGDPSGWDVEKRERFIRQLMLFSVLDKFLDQYIPYDKGITWFSYFSAEKYSYFFNRNLIGTSSIPFVNSTLRYDLAHQQHMNKSLEFISIFKGIENKHKENQDYLAIDITPSYYDPLSQYNIFSLNFYTYDLFGDFLGTYSVNISIKYLESELLKLTQGFYENLGVIRIYDKSAQWEHTLFNSPQLPDSELLNRKIYFNSQLINSDDKRASSSLYISYFLSDFELLVLYWRLFKNSILMGFLIIFAGNLLIVLLYNRHQQFKDLCKDEITDVYSLYAFNHLVKPRATDMLSKDVPVSIIMIDGNRLKEISDIYGHHVGQLAVQHMAQKIVLQIRKQDYLCRIGSDEFVVVALDANEDDVKEIIRRVQSSVEEPFLRISDMDLSLTVSCGGYTLSKHQSIELGLKLADRALYRTTIETD